MLVVIARVRTRHRRWPGSAGEGGWEGERRRAGQAARPRCSTPPAAFPGRPQSGGLSFAAWPRRCVGHDESSSLPPYSLPDNKCQPVTTASGPGSGPLAQPFDVDRAAVPFLDLEIGDRLDQLREARIAVIARVERGAVAGPAADLGDACEAALVPLRRLDRVAEQLDHRFVDHRPGI